MTRVPREDSSHQGEEVGWVGLGAIGLPMATRAAATGHRVLGWDPVAERREAAVRAGIEIAPEPAAVGGGEAALVVCAVRSSEQVAEALLGPGGALRAGQVGLVMSSVGAVSMRDLGRRASAGSRVLLDAPILGNPAAAEAGKLIVPLAGDAAAKRAARPLLGELGSVVEAGERLGAAQAIKDVSQQLQILGMLATIEALDLAAGEGVEADLVLAVLERTEPSWATANWDYAASLWRRGDRESSLGLFAKDLASALRDAHETGVEMPLTGRGLELLEGRLDSKSETL